MREILFFLRSRCCNSGSFSKRPSALILSSSLLLNSLAREHTSGKGYMSGIATMIVPKCSRVLRYVCIVSHTENSKKRERERKERNWYLPFVTPSLVFDYPPSNLFSLPRYNNAPPNKFCELHARITRAEIGVAEFSCDIPSNSVTCAVDCFASFVINTF